MTVFVDGGDVGQEENEESSMPCVSDLSYTSFSERGD